MASQEGISLDQTVDPVIDSKLATQNIWETLGHLNQCAAIRELVASKDLHYLLERVELQTFLAPIDGSFDGNGDESASRRLVEGQLLTRIFQSYDLNTANNVQTFGGEKLPVRHEGETTFIGEAKLVQTDIPCTNGVIHVVEGLTSHK